MSSFISATAWVRRGVAARNPQKYVLDEKELKRVSALARIEFEDAKVELERASKLAQSMGEDLDPDDAETKDDEWEDLPSDDLIADGMDVDNVVDGDPPASRDPNDLSEYNLDTYDEEENTLTSGPFSNIKGLTYHGDNDDDPYITLKEDDEAEEREEVEVYPTDNLIVAAKTEEDVAQLEVYVYDESQDNLYVHHDLMLPSIPLCLEWLDYAPGTSSETSRPGSFIAVGTFEPEIEIWSLDTIDGLYPDGVLGRPDKTRENVPVPSAKGKKTKRKQPNDEYHIDAVLGLSWNKAHRNLLASASADKTIKLWDLSRESGSGAIRSFNVYKDKVQAVHWSPAEPTVLLTGGFDHSVRIFDSRAPDTAVGVALGADVEALRWDPWDPHGFYVSLKNGLVLNFDARTLPSKIDQSAPARFTLSAHYGAVLGLDVNPHFKGCIATGGADKIVKVWNVETNGASQQLEVSMITSRDLDVGKVFSVTWSPDDPLTLAAGGSKGKLQIWEVGATTSVRNAFKSKLTQTGKEIREKETGDGIIGVNDDGGESGDEE